MTREELINLGEMYLEANPASKSTDRYEFVEKSLELLEQKPCEDAVSRKAVDLLCFEFLRANSDDNIAFYEHFRDLPSVTLTRKKGKWIKIGDRGFGYSDTVICKCSECEYKAEFTGKFDGLRLVVDMERAYKFCPNCGAEMESEK